MDQPHTPLRVPDHMSRADICAYLRELRLHFGLSESDVSERLHIRVKYVTAIEQGAFEAMPGKAYARGYVHTYAEFLGLDADQVVERCFGPELAREVQAHALPSSSQKKGKTGRWPLLAALVVFGFLGFAALHDTGRGGDEADDAEPQVEAVPESYLASLRTMVMPTADSIDCFAERRFLGCFYAQRSTRLWATPPAKETPMIPADVVERMEREQAARKQEEEAPADAVVKPSEKPVETKPAAKPAVKAAPAADEKQKAREAAAAASRAAEKAAEEKRQAAIDAAKEAQEASKKAAEDDAKTPPKPAVKANETSILPATQELHFGGDAGEGND